MYLLSSAGRYMYCASSVDSMGLCMFSLLINWKLSKVKQSLYLHGHFIPKLSPVWLRNGQQWQELIYWTNGGPPADPQTDSTKYTIEIRVVRIWFGQVCTKKYIPFTFSIKLTCHGFSHKYKCKHVTLIPLIMFRGDRGLQDPGVSRTIRDYSFSLGL